MNAFDCTARIGDRPEDLLCQRKDPHVTGHVFWSTNGSHLLAAEVDQD